jgi:hypothetical protein
MVLASWGIGFSLVQVPRFMQLIALVFWSAGFALLYLGRFKLGESFRLGTSKEDTSLKTDGLFRLSRSGNLPEDMPDQAFLCFMDVFQQRGFVHAHLLCQFTGVNPAGMIEKPGPV